MRSPTPTTLTEVIPRGWPFGEKAALDGGEQRLGHRMPAARAADEDRVAVLHEAGRFVRADLFHRLSSLEHRRAFSQKRRDTFVQIGAVEDALLGESRCGERSIERAVLRGVDERLAEAVG
jgi:hypothetical protein